MIKSNWKRATAGLLLAALVVATVAPAAEAGKKYRYKGKSKHRGHRVERVVYQPATVTHVHHHSSTAPALAFLGGVVLGAVISNAHAEPTYVERVYVEPDYYYYDTYCSRRFVSLSAFHTHVNHHHHPNVVRVFHVSSGNWVDTVHYHDGHWVRYEARW